MASSLPSPLPTIFSTASYRIHHPFHRPQLSVHPNRKILSLFLARSADNGADAAGSAAVEEKKLEERVEAAASLPAKEEKEEKEVKALGLIGAEVAHLKAPVFRDPRWVGGTWDLVQFQAGGGIDWDAVIDAEARRRKWLEDNPEASSNDEPVVFDASIIPWWSWIKRYHLPEAELLNGRAAMVGFFMAYFVDSLTGIGLVDQTGNFFCKTLLFISVAGVLLIRKNEDVEKLKKLIEETTFYDKQWQATWQEDNQNNSKNK